MTQTTDVGQTLGSVAKHGQTIEEGSSFGHGAEVMAGDAECFVVVRERFGSSVNEACALGDELLFGGDGSLSDCLGSSL